MEIYFPLCPFWCIFTPWSLFITPSKLQCILSQQSDFNENACRPTRYAIVLKQTGHLLTWNFKSYSSYKCKSLEYLTRLKAMVTQWFFLPKRLITQRFTNNNINNSLMFVMAYFEYVFRDYCGYGLSQCETTLRYSVVSHWLSPYSLISDKPCVVYKTVAWRNNKTVAWRNNKTVAWPKNIQLRL